ncbi:MAG: cyclic nucleotide-binding domain-containing protein, partial [Bacteroidota bacterium]
SQMDDADIIFDLIANLFNKDILMLQTADFTIYKIDRSVYFANTARLKTGTKKELDRAILPPVYLQEGEEYIAKLLLIEKVLLLRRHEVFGEIPGELLTQLADTLEEVRVDGGTELITVGDKGTSPIYMIRFGEVAINRDGEQPELLREGALFGEQLLLDSERFDFSATTTEDSCLILLRKEELTDLMAKHVEVVEAYLKLVGPQRKEEEEEELEMGIL